MPDCRNSKITSCALAFLLAMTFAGCATKRPLPEPPPPVDEKAVPPAPSPESLRIIELEKQLAERQKHCADEKRRLEGALKETQTRLDDTQKKLKAVLAVERALRRGKEQ